MERGLFNELSQFCFTYQENDDIWFVGNEYSLVFQANIRDCTIKKIIRIEENALRHSGQYRKLVKIEKKIVILPSGHNKIVIYNMENDKFSAVYLREKTSPSMSYVTEEEKLYIINNTEIIVLDIKHEKVEEYISIPYRDDMLNVMALKFEGHIMIPLVYENQILDFTISEKQFTRLQLECDANGFVAGMLDGTDVWLAGCNGNIVKWNYINRKCILYDKLPEDFESFDYDKDGNFMPWEKGWRQGVCFKYWYSCILVDDKIWFLPFLSNSLLYIDKKTNVIHKYPFENEFETETTMKTHRCLKFLLIGVQEERYIKIYSVKRNIIYSIDAVTLNYVEEVFCIDKVDAVSIEREFKDAIYVKSSAEGILENSNISIRELLSTINKNKTNININTIDENVGTRIYQYLNLVNG